MKNQKFSQNFLQWKARSHSQRKKSEASFISSSANLQGFSDTSLVDTQDSEVFLMKEFQHNKS